MSELEGLLEQRRNLLKRLRDIGAIIDETQRELEPLRNALQDPKTANREFLEWRIQQVEAGAYGELVGEQRSLTDRLRQLGVDIDTQEAEQKRAAETADMARRVEALCWLFVVEQEFENKEKFVREALALVAKPSCGLLVAWDKVDRAALALFLLGGRDFAKVAADIENLTDNLKRLHCLEPDVLSDPRVPSAQRKSLDLCCSFNEYMEMECEKSKRRRRQELEDLIG